MIALKSHPTRVRGLKHYALPTIKARQQAYEATYSNQLLEEYYSTCSTNSDCEALEDKLNFDFKKGMN